MARMIPQMVKTSRIFRLTLPVAAALLYVVPAHAGMLGWMDDAFTFRKEQKPLITPRRTTVPPRVVVQPYYPNDEHVAWSNFYTRTDLEPQDYLSSSASKVMRPKVTPQEAAASSPAQGEGGWPAIAERAAANAQAESEDGAANVMIGDPGDSPMMAAGDSQVGRATRIGPAVQDWRDDGQARIASRPGDYDYRAPVGGNTVTAANDSNIAIGAPQAAGSDDRKGGSTITFTTDKTAADTSGDPRYVGHNAKGQVTKYKVQGGDTLSSISGQPAIYGTWKLWPLIYSANRSAIGGSPTNLKTQQRLDIPRDYTQKQADEAEQKAGGR